MTAAPATQGTAGVVYAHSMFNAPIRCCDKGTEPQRGLEKRSRFGLIRENIKFWNSASPQISIKVFEEMIRETQHIWEAHKVQTFSPSCYITDTNLRLVYPLVYLASI